MTSAVPSHRSLTVAAACYGHVVGPDEITVAWVSEVFDADVAAVSTSPIGDGLVGLNLRVSIDSDDPDVPATAVAKLPSLDQTSRATGIALRNYEREVKFYQEIADTVDICIPRCFHANWDAATGNFSLLLEDMAPAEQGDQVAGCGPDDAFAAVTELARLHAPRWDDPSLDAYEWLGRRTNPDDLAAVVGLWQMMLPGFLDGFAKHLDTEQLDLLNEFGPRLEPWLHGRDGPSTVTHGDYRLDNLLFGDGETAPLVTAVDWQTPGHGAPVADLSYFCGAGLLPADRRALDRDLTERYAEELAANGVDIDLDWLWYQYRRDAFGGLVMAVIASQVVGESERSEAMFTAMASRHLVQALDLDSLTLI